MGETYNIYCDESCHLEHDGQKAMVLGALWCPLGKTREIAVRLREIKQKHGLKSGFEIKWTKVSRSGAGLYRDILDYFFDDDDLHFRALVIPDKSLLNHEAFPGQDHDLWYYKMYFSLLKAILSPQSRYRIYLDIKDTRGGKRTRTLHEVLCNDLYDFSREIVEWVQLAHSSEIEQIQLVDLLVGAVSYVSRGMGTNEGKLVFVDRMRARSGYSLSRSTLLREEKVNLFVWHARETGP
jgi:hypothetical protein